MRGEQGCQPGARLRKWQEVTRAWMIAPSVCGFGALVWERTTSGRDNPPAKVEQKA